MSSKVSVVMSTYNDSKYIREAVESILNQSFLDFEFIIIDDASTDGTPEIIKNYNDSRIKLFVNESNLGLTKNLNKALKMASGCYIARMDGDDISYPQRLQEQVEYLDKHKDVYLLGTAVQNIGASDLRWKLPDDSEDLKVRMLLHPVFAHPSLMFRKELVEEGIIYDESFRTAQDYDFVVRVSKNHKIGRLQHVLLNYRVHDRQISITSTNEQMDNASRIRNRLLNDLDIKLSDSQQIIYNNWVSEKKLDNAKGYKRVYELIELISRGNDIKKIYDDKKLSIVLRKLLYTWIIRSKSVKLLLRFPYLCNYNGENMQIFCGEIVRTMREKLEKFVSE
ncbi:glycosyltransferase family 2 protein [Butyrivibrio sp.]|uniref:glycosyltransferase family 2 protein n=1 Tax=Butyrivibrio sp. TaxID=28121 RepID=UPI0025C2DA79|nr:glycosyltransferase [Butyrivibrio sp.]MBE5837197.1 glycosyltransferase [Butyrivibrio sp.]